jgi:tRNA(Ile)-lysidine synthase
MSTARSSLAERALETIRRHRMCAPGDRIGVAVSGGGDSVALLALLMELREELGVTLAGVHFHHGLRGAEADADEIFVAGVVRAHGLEFFSDRADVAAEARARGWNLEEAGRRLREAFFSRLIADGRATRIALAHTADDQAETVLGHIVRGTGAAGLAGIHPVRGWVIRPLLDLRREALREYLRERGLAWREDASNRDTARLRARLRLEILPAMECIQPATVEHLAGLAERARRDEKLWEELVERRFEELVTREAGAFTVVAANLCRPLAFNAGEEAQEALAARLVRRLLREVKGDLRRITAQHVEQVLRLATEGRSGSRVELPDGVAVERALEGLVFRRRPAAAGGRHRQESAADFEYAVELPREGAAAVAIPEIGRRVRLKVIDWPPAPGETSQLAEVLDRDLLRPPLVLRNWRPGDAYRPCGRRRVHKVKRLFLARRVAAGQRRRRPVLTSAGRLVWAAGLPVAADYAAGETTRAALVVLDEAL